MPGSRNDRVECHELKDLNGQSFANGLQLTGPAPDGELLLRDSSKNVKKETLKTVESF
jgi:hypothetical protein